MKKEIKQLLNTLNAWSNGRIEHAPNGTVLVGYAKHVSEIAYLHRIFPACSELDIDVISAETGMVVPNELGAMLRICNGFDLFGGALSVYGKRTDFKRDLASTISQPYSIVTPNTIERPAWIAAPDWIIGSYEWDGTLVVLQSCGRLFASPQEKQTVIHEWSSLCDFMDLKIKRLGSFFSLEGVELDGERCNLPPQIYSY